MEQDKTFLGTEPIGKLLIKLAVPTVIAQLVNMLYNIIDRVYIGHIPGEGSMVLTGVGVCMPLILIIAAFAALVGSGGSPRASILMTVLIGAVANIILDPIFIFGMHMGVCGAALATVISQGLSCVWVLSFLSGKKTLLRIKKENILPGFRLVPPCVALGASMFVMQVSESVIFVCFNSSLLKYGDDIAVGAMTILTSVMQFAMLPFSLFTL